VSKNNILISIVVPLYNSEVYINDTIQSVINQTYKNWELFIVDDCSTDNSRSVVKKLVEIDSRVHLIELENNSGGPAMPRNIGIRLSNGDYIAFLDSDDIWFNNKIYSIVQRVTLNNKIDVVCHEENLRLMGKSTNITLHHGPYDRDFYKILLLSGNRLSPSATCVRTSFIKDNNIYFNELSDYVIIEDYDLWLRLAEKHAFFDFITCPLGEYAVQNASISLDIGKSRRNLEIMLKNHVYHIQTFSSKKDILWSIVSFRLLVGDVRQKYRDSYLLLRLSMYFTLVIKHPIGAIFYVKFFIKRRVRNYLLEYIGKDDRIGACS
jgi:glycosyltransferase involved in cell wall biosynthesis